MSPKMGRPPSDNPKTETIKIRVTPSEKKEIFKFKDEQGYTLLELIQLGIEAVKKK